MITTKTKELLIDHNEINTSNRFKFNSLKEFYTGLNSTTHISLPNGFGTKLNLFKSNSNNLKSSNCPVLNCMIKEGIIKFNHRTNIINTSSIFSYEMYLLFSSLLFNFYNVRKSHINQQSIEQNTKPSPQIVYREEEVPYVFFSMKKEDKDNSLMAKLGGASANGMQRMVEFFVKYKFIELYSDYKSFNNLDKGESIQEKRARRYIVSEQFDRVPCRYKFQHPRMSLKMEKVYKRKLEKVFGANEAIDFEKMLLTDDNIQSFSFPSINEVIEKARYMVENQKRDKHDRVYVYEIPSEWMHEDNGKTFTGKRNDGTTFTYTVRGKIKPGCPYVNINQHINSYMMMINGEKLLKARRKYKSQGKEYFDRYYYTLALFPKWIREMIIIDGEEIVEVDYTALHSRIVNKLYQDNVESIGGNKESLPFLEGDSHSKVAALLGINRATAKRIGLSYWNSRISNKTTISSKTNAGVFEAMDEFLKRSYPDFFKYLEFVKTRQKKIKSGMKRHSNMSAMLMDMENRLMQYVMERIDFPVIYVYDCLYVGKSRQEYVKKLFDEALKSFGIL